MKHESSHGSISEQVDQFCDRFEADWLSGRSPVLENYLDDVDEAQRASLLRELLVAEWDLRVAADQPVEVDDYLKRLPNDAVLVRLAHAAWCEESDRHVRGNAVDQTVAMGSDATLDSLEQYPHLPGYEILEVLGHGGMGVVYRARDLQLNRNVALKMVLAGRNASSSELKRFVSEAKAVASLNHPNVVQVYEATQHDQCPFMVLEYIAGGSLAARLEDGPLSVREAASIIERVARGMNAAHQCGLVHRDLKPANILIDTDGNPKVTDFGLVKHVEDDSGLTQTGTLMGTPSYMAPEQARGESHNVGPAADVYSLGATLYACLTGVPPHKTDSTVETIRRVVEEEPIPLRQVRSQIPRDLETICLKALNKDPARRYASAAALADELACWLDNRPILARPITRTERTVKWCRRRPALAALVVVSGLALTSLVSGAIYFNTRLQRERDEAIALRIVAQKNELAANDQREIAKREKAEALSEAKKAATVSDFLVGLFEDTDVFGLSGRSFGVLPSLNPRGREILARGQRKLTEEGAFRDEPLLKATLMHNLGKSYLSLGDIDSARELLEESLELRKKHLAADHPDYAASVHENALLCCFTSDVDAGVEACRNAFKLHRKIHGDDHPLTLQSEFQLGALYCYQPNTDLAKKHLRHVVQIRRARLVVAEEANSDDLDNETETLIAAVAFLTSATIASGDTLRASTLVLELRSLAKTIPDQEKANLAVDIVDSYIFRRMGQLKKAEAAYIRSIAAIKNLLGEDHFFLYSVLQEYAGLCFESERYEEAEVMMREQLRIARESLSNSSNVIARCCYNVSRSMARGRLRTAESAKDQETYEILLKEAEDLAREAVARDGIRLSFQPRMAGVYDFYLAWLLLRKDSSSLEEPTKLYRQAWNSRCHALGYNDVLSTLSLSHLLQILAQQRRFDELQEHFETHLAELTEKQTWNEKGLRLLVIAAATLEKHGKLDTSIQLVQQAVKGGFDVAQLQRHSQFEQLSKRREFQELVEAAGARSANDSLLDKIKDRLFK